jgi:hypothetical protein
VSTPRQPGRYGFAQPLHVTCADAGAGKSHVDPKISDAIILRNIGRLGNIGGRQEDRTPDLCVANAALSQLS